MSKDDYILRSLSKTRHKRIEHFVVNRIYHLLDDPEIEFVCQQLVRRSDGPALTDMYFPQFRLHLEVDEPFHERNVEADQTLLHKRVGGRISPFPGQIYPTASVTGMPSAV
ncbi:AbaSI family restriction endonuclease [Paracoccus aminovorans]|uniref:AbaSI family restriction endonuclease n=1 Tax=Paracoccus aminovorans TaxID=34004 RepID=UPI002B25DC52|nr:hypothetical protein [Paracoccus aminovorans]